MRWLLVVGIVAVSLVVVAAVAGAFLPATHVAVTRSRLTASPVDVFAALADWERWSEWHPEIRSVERLPDHDGNPVLMTRGSWGDVPTEIVESEPPRVLVTEVDGGGFRGRWTYRVEPADGGTELTITEEGVVSNPLFRAMIVFRDNHETMLAFHRALGQRLGEVITPERLGVPVERE